MKRKNKTNKIFSLKDIYQELIELQSLYKIEHESLWSCCDEARDYGHIFSLSEIFNQKIQKVTSDFKTMLS